MRQLMTIQGKLEDFRRALRNNGYSFIECDQMAKKLFSEMTDKFENVNGMQFSDFRGAMQWFDAQAQSMLS